MIIQKAIRLVKIYTNETARPFESIFLILIFLKLLHFLCLFSQ